MGIEKEKYYQARMLLLDYIVELCKEKGITQTKIAEITGFSQSNISRIFSGKYSPTLDNFIRILDAVDTYFFIIDKNADDDLVEIMKNRWKRNAEEN